MEIETVVAFAPFAIKFIKVLRFPPLRLFILPQSTLQCSYY